MSKTNNQLVSKDFKSNQIIFHSSCFSNFSFPFTFSVVMFSFNATNDFCKKLSSKIIAFHFQVIILFATKNLYNSVSHFSVHNNDFVRSSL
ncbi:hypothetical protein HOF65_03090 [bacterium]|nr:hypothetical protein [bacterium]MBT3852979.1 hypothetical protein [bacterium]MBT5490790.1 hypothetical protein [bacterium]MBT6778805.1 hypothetical protein [bacterium]